MTIIADLKIGDSVKFGKTVVFVRRILPNCVLVSKQPEGLYLFSVPVFSCEHKDLLNRVELA